jgi:hypothetical protein
LKALGNSVSARFVCCVGISTAQSPNGAVRVSADEVHPAFMGADAKIARTAITPHFSTINPYEIYPNFPEGTNA